MSNAANSGLGKDAVGMFIALASFALAESTALTVVARDDDKQMFVLSIYVIVVLFTLAWIIYMLRLGRGRHGTAFDRTSMHYGYFTLVWNIVLAVIMLVLAANRLLPNQTSRNFLPFDQIAVQSAYPGDRALIDLESESGVRLTNYEAWIALSQRTSGTANKDNSDETTTIVWLLQKGHFDDHFRSKRFRVGLTDDTVLIDPRSCGDQSAPTAEAPGGHIRLLRRAAFLASVEPRHMNPVYRQLPFSESGNELGCDFLLIDPNPSEKLMVVLEVRHPAKLDLKTVDFVITKM